jgi:hypothetical protein
VYGHVDIPDNDHWDPGSLEYAQLFQMVRDVTNPAGSDAMSDYEKGMAAFATAARNGNPDKPAETDWTTEKKQGYRDARLLYTNPQATTISVGSHNHSTVEVAGPATT